MTQLNSVILEGRVAHKPFVHEFTSNTAVCTISVAVNRSYKNNNGGYTDEVSFFDIKTFGKYAASYAERIDVGIGIRIIGRLKQEHWTTAEGKKRNKIIVIAEHIYLSPLQKRRERDNRSSDKELSDLAEAAAARQTETETEIEDAVF